MPDIEVENGDDEEDDEMEPEEEIDESVSKSPNFLNILNMLFSVNETFVIFLAKFSA